MPRELGAGFRGLSDLGGAGKEHEDVACGSGSRQPADGSADLLRKAPIIGHFQMLDLHREAPPLAADDLGLQVLRKGRGFERGRHDDQLDPRKQASGERKREIAREMSLVEFVQHHRAHPSQRGIREDATREDALGDVPEARAREHCGPVGAAEVNGTRQVAQLSDVLEKQQRLRLASAGHELGQHRPAMVHEADLAF